MRIEAYNQVSRIYGSSKPSRTKGSRNVEKRDEVSYHVATGDFAAKLIEKYEAYNR